MAYGFLDLESRASNSSIHLLWLQFYIKAFLFHKRPRQSSQPYIRVQSESSIQPASAALSPPESWAQEARFRV